jgi:methionyl-tRNA formyltransferase
MRIVFFGTSEFGLPSLNALNEKHEIAAVVTRPDAIKGRGMNLLPSPVKTAALRLGHEVLAPESLKNPEFIEQLISYKADLFYVVAFRILPPEVFIIPPKGTVNLHASLLPDYRGAAPVNWAVINGDSVTGLTTFFIDENIDTGEIILKEEVRIGPDETAGELAERLMNIGAVLSLKTIVIIENNIVEPISQPSGLTRPAPKLTKNDGLIDWSKDVRTVHNRIRGVNPVPGAFTLTGKGLLKINRTKIYEETSEEKPGLINRVSSKEGFTVSCGKGSLMVLEIQPAGKKNMDGASFVSGYRIKEGINIFEILRIAQN